MLRSPGGKLCSHFQDQAFTPQFMATARISLNARYFFIIYMYLIKISTWPALRDFVEQLSVYFQN